MIVTFDENGVLKISAEKPIESFALKCWAEDYFGDVSKINSEKLLIQTTIMESAGQ